MLFSRPQQLSELTIEPPAESRDDPEGILFTLDHEDGRDHLITTMSSLSFQASYDSRDESEFSFSRLDDAREESERVASRSNTSKEVGGVVDTLRKMRMMIEDKPELIDHISIASKESSFSQVKKKGPNIPRFFSRDDRKTKKFSKSKSELPPKSPSFKPIVRNRKSGQPAALGRDKILVPLPPRHSKDTIVPQEEVRVFNDGNATELVLPESMNGNFADDCSKATDISSALSALREMRQIVATNSDRNESEKKKELTGSPSKGFLTVVNDRDETVQGRSNCMDENIADDQHSKASDMHTALHALREMRQTITTNCNFDEDAKREMSLKVSVIDTRDTKPKTGTFKIEVKKSAPASTEDRGQIKSKTGRKQVEDLELLKAVTNEGNRSMDGTSTNDLEIDKDSDPLSFEQGQVELVLDPTDTKPDNMGMASAFVSIVTNSIEGFNEQPHEKLAIQQEKSESGTTGHSEVEGDSNKPIGLLSKLFGSKFAASNTSEKTENASARIVADVVPEDFQPEPCSKSVYGLETSMLEGTYSNSLNDKSIDAMHDPPESNGTAPECPDEEGSEYFQQGIKAHEDHFSQKEVEVTRNGIEDTVADRSSVRSISAVEVADKRVEAAETERSSPMPLEENQKDLAKSTVVQPEVEVTISGGQPSIGKTVDIAFEGDSHKVALLQDPPKTTVKDGMTSKSKNKQKKTESKRRKGDKNNGKLKRKPRHELPLEYITRGVTKKSTRKCKTKHTKEPTKISDTEKNMPLSALVFRDDTGGTSRVSEETMSAGATETGKQNDATKDEDMPVFEGKVDNSCESDQANVNLKDQNITNKAECSLASDAPTDDEESTDDDSADIYHLKEEKESRRDTSGLFERPQPKRHYTEIYPVASARSRNTKNASSSGHAFITSSQEKTAEESFVKTEPMNPSSYTEEANSRRASSDDSEGSSIFQANSRSYDSWDPSRRAGVDVWMPDSSTNLFTDDRGEMGGLGLVESLSVFEDRAARNKRKAIGANESKELIRRSHQRSCQGQQSLLKPP